MKQIGYKVYEVLSRNRYIMRGKEVGRVNRNENLHSKLRGYLACLRRRTKVFSKTLDALQQNLYLFSILFIIYLMTTQFLHHKSKNKQVLIVAEKLLRMSRLKRASTQTVEIDT